MFNIRLCLKKKNSRLWTTFDSLYSTSSAHLVPLLKQSLIWHLSFVNSP